MRSSQDVGRKIDASTREKGGEEAETMSARKQRDGY
jgi:hypothetical protein